jgi:hypothetical protein
MGAHCAFTGRSRTPEGTVLSDLYGLFTVALIASPITVALLIAWRTGDANAPVSPIAIAIGALAGVVVATIPLLYYTGLFPEQPYLPDALHSGQAAAFFYIALCGWLGGTIGIAAAITLVSRRAGGWYCVFVGGALGILSVLSADPNGVTHDRVPMPFWWRLFVAQESAPVVYVSLVMLVFAAWLLRRRRNVVA